MGFFRDFRQALRLLSRTPTLTAVALLSVAVTIGATAVVFTAVKAVLIQPLPYANADRIVQFRTESKRGKSQAYWVTWSDMLDLARSNHSFQSIGAYQYALFNLPGDGNSPPEALYG
jgi:putative ABC transport system permease protein